MLACYIRRAVGTHEHLYYDSSGQRRAEPQLTGLGTSCAPVLFLSSQRNIPGLSLFGVGEWVGGVVVPVG